MASMRTHSTERAPALPKELLEDLTFSVAVQPAAPRRSLFAALSESLQSMLASPAFGSAAAAIVVLAVASSVIMRPDAPSRSESFRGASAYSAADTARVILVGAPVGMQDELENQTDFEDGVFTTSASIEATAGLKGARVIVDFSAGTLTAINVKGETVYQSKLPESTSGISLEIALALTRF